MGKKRHNVDTSLDTSIKKRIISEEVHNTFFPHSLYGRKYKRITSSQWGIYIEQYMETEDPDYLLKTLKENYTILKNVEQNFEEEFAKETIQEPQNNPDPIYVDAHTIVWETIEWWRLLSGSPTKQLANEVRKYLLNVGRALILPQRVGIRLPMKDGLVHVFMKAKGEKPFSLEYRSAYRFIRNWDHIKNKFQAKKKRYKTIIQPLLKEMREEGNENIAFVVRMHKENLPKIQDIKKLSKMYLARQYQKIR